MAERTGPVAAQLVAIGGIGELEERQRAAVGEAEEGVAVGAPLAAQVLDLAPRGDEREAEDVLVEVAGALLIGDDPRVVVHPGRQVDAFWQGIDRHGRDATPGLECPSGRTTSDRGSLPFERDRHAGQRDPRLPIHAPHLDGGQHVRLLVERPGLDGHDAG